MSCYAITDASGALLSSTCGVVADPLPAGLVAHPITDEAFALLRSGGTWDPETLTVSPCPEPPDLTSEIEDARQALAEASPEQVGVAALAYLDLLIPSHP